MDQELESSSLLTSEELRAVALAAAHRRGVSVARKRIVVRWTAWLLWGWLLPLIGVATVIAALLTLASVTFWGPAKVFDTSQTWLAEQLGLPKTKATVSSFDSHPNKSLDEFPSFIVIPGVVPQLQIDRNYSSQNPDNAAVPSAPVSNVPTTPTVATAPVTPAISTVPNPSSPPKPPGAQP